MGLSELFSKILNYCYSLKIRHQNSPTTKLFERNKRMLPDFAQLLAVCRDVRRLSYVNYGPRETTWLYVYYVRMYRVCIWMYVRVCVERLFPSMSVPSM